MPIAPRTQLLRSARMNPDLSQIESALFFYKSLSFINAGLTFVVGVATLYAIFRRQPPIDDVIRKMEKRWLEQDTEREKALTVRLAGYQLREEARQCEQRHAQWVGEVDRRAVHFAKDVETRSDKKFDELRADVRAVNATLQTVAKDVAQLAGKVEQ